MLNEWRVIVGDVREKLAELPGASVQCVVTSCSSSAPFLQLERSELSEQHVGSLGKLRWHRLEPKKAVVFARRRHLATQRVQRNAQFNLPPLALHIWQHGAKQIKGFLLYQPKPVIRTATTERSYSDSLRVREQRVDEVDGTTVCHSQFKPNRVTRRLAALSGYSLDADVALSINHRSKVSELPVFQCVCVAHTQC